MVFSKIISSNFLLEMERYDDDLAKIANNSDSASHYGSYRSNTTDSTSSTSVSYFSIPSLHREDLHRISRIGSGKFCHVHMVTGPSTLINDPNDNDVNNDNDNFHRRQLFALKSVDPSKTRNVDDLTLATTQLANEAKILSQLDHENIIQLRGVSSEPFSQSYASGGDGYFLILDLLTETLSDRLQKWRGQSKRKNVERNSSKGILVRAKNSSSNLLKVPFRALNSKSKLDVEDSGGINSCNNPNCRSLRQQALHERIEETAIGIAKGILYLHSRNIILRDLKPANIGYADNIYENTYNSNNHNKNIEKALQQNKLRLFDFGMAQKLEECDPSEICGSLRYMAPEVMAGKGYSLGVDVYSFGVILFEICSLKVPFDDHEKQKQKMERKVSSNNLLRKVSSSNNLLPKVSSSSNLMRKVGNNLLRKNSSKSSLLSKSDNNKSSNHQIHHCESLTLTLAVEKRMISDFHKSLSFCGPMKTNEDLEKLIPCPRIRKLIEECLNEDPNNRPSFQNIISRLVFIFNNDSSTESTQCCCTGTQISERLGFGSFDNEVVQF
mmetsp:Transcript_24670/g.50976  ORF Transcript_24670/g.50976 Transcript_24670/m.50976 type:complete len:554 (-) Transcript_24670:104-1765(-)